MNRAKRSVLIRWCGSMVAGDVSYAPLLLIGCIRSNAAGFLFQNHRQNVINLSWLLKGGVGSVGGPNGGDKQFVTDNLIVNIYPPRMRSSCRKC